jgi:hypothetical protein
VATITEEVIKELKRKMVYDEKVQGLRWINSLQRAGCRRHDGYILVGLNRKLYLMHRLVWAYFNGAPVPAIIDHKDNKPYNNCIDNLRVATKSQNQHNSNSVMNNKFGLRNVTWNAQRNSWRVRIRVQGTTYEVGSFKTMDEAHTAYVKKAKELLGEFAYTKADFQEDEEPNRHLLGA